MRWEEHYRSGDTPWDLGRAHPELESRLSSGWVQGAPPGRVCVPGCGTGHDALAFSRAGWSVTAIDIVDATDGRLDRELRSRKGEFVEGDALSLIDRDRFDLVWDHTFFCAIDPRKRPDWGEMVGRLVRPGGFLAGISFPEDRGVKAGGPPWGTSVETISGFLDGFELIEAARPTRTVQRRRGREHWYTFARG